MGLNLNDLVNGGDKYHVFISVGGVQIYDFLTASVVGRSLSQDVNPIGAIGTESAIAVKRGLKTNAFNISLQDGEAIKILQAVKLMLGSDIHDFRDFPANTNVAVVNMEDGSIEKYIGCAFSADNKNIERNSLETMRELSGTCLDFKSV